MLALPAEVKRMPANRDFLRLGEVASHVCMIASGMVARFDQTMAGLRQLCAVYVPGDMPDLASAVLPRPGLGLQTLSEALLVRVPRNAIQRVAARHPAIAQAMWRECAIDAGIVARWLLNIGRRDAKTRMAHLLCEIAIRLQAELRDNRTSFDLQMTQTQLADATGLTPVHVNRTLMALRATGLISYEHRQVTIWNWAELAAAGEFDPGYLHADAQPETRLSMAN